MPSISLAEDFFRHQYGRLVCQLSAKVGLDKLEVIEDSVQAALVSALETWPIKGQPDKPTAWLYRVANNKLIDQLRQSQNQQRILKQYRSQQDNKEALTKQKHNSLIIEELDEQVLKMLFVCCDPKLAINSQLVFALKILCGFDVDEISHRLFCSNANVYKRLNRAKHHLQQTYQNKDLTFEQSQLALPSVHKVLYLLFTEGYLSVASQFAIQQQLCQEAIRLTDILANHPTGQDPATFALLALMYFQFSRISSRLNNSGGLLLLEEQDRSQWHKESIALGMQWLAQSAQGNVFSRYHAEAAIAAEHCLAPSFKETNWQAIVENYQLLEQSSPSAIHRLNQAVAVAEWKSPAVGLALLESFQAPSWLTSSYLWYAVCADLQQRNDNKKLAEQLHATALESAPNEDIKVLLKRRYELNTKY